MPSLQDLETVPENSQLKSTILLHHDPGCNGLAAGAALDTSGPPIRNVEAFLEASTTPNPRILHRCRSCQRRTTGRVVQETPPAAWSRSYSAVQGPGDRSASAIITHTGAHDSIHLRIVY